MQISFVTSFSRNINYACNAASLDDRKQARGILGVNRVSRITDVSTDVSCLEHRLLVHRARCHA